MNHPNMDMLDNTRNKGLNLDFCNKRERHLKCNNYISITDCLSDCLFLVFYIFCNHCIVLSYFSIYRVFNGKK